MAASSTFTVERTRLVPASVDVVRERIVDFRRWRAWSPWEDVDPDLRRSYGGPPSGVGATYEWEGNRKAGKGRMEITSVEDDVVTVELRFVKPFRSHSTTRFTLRPDGHGTEVTWTMTGPTTFMTRVMGIFTSMDKVIGPDFEKGLDRLADDAAST